MLRKANHFPLIMLSVSLISWTGSWSDAIKLGNTHYANSLYQCVGRRFNIAPRGLSPDRIRQQCLAREISESTTNQLVNVLTQCDYARFAPVVTPLDEVEMIASRAKDALKEIE